MQPLKPAIANELWTWIHKTVSLFDDRILPFGAEEALVGGVLSVRLGHSGADLMMAATGIARDSVIVTGNEDDFLPTSVAIENPYRV